MNISKAAFLDRDGVINKDYGYVHKWEDFDFCEGAIDGMSNLINLEFKIIIITNQSGIDRGLFTESQYQFLTKKMINYLKKNQIKITDIYHCPHHPDFSKKPFSYCNCRKPKPGLFLEASKSHNINIKESISIGDSKRDLIASKLAGIRKTYLISNKTDLVKEEYFEESFESLLECSEFLKNDSIIK